MRLGFPFMMTSVRAVTAAPSTLSVNLAAYWKLDEGVGVTTAQDATTNNIDLTQSGVVGNSPDGGFNSTHTGRINTCWYDYPHNGIDDEVLTLNAAHNAIFNSANYSIQVWIKRVVTGTRQVWLMNHSNNSSNGFTFKIGTDDKLHLIHNGSTDVTSTGTITDTSAFHHVVVTYDGTNAKFYIDGAASGSPTLSAFSSSTNSLIIGYNVLGSQDRNVVANTYLDEIGFWSRALTSSEITQLYNSGAGLPFASF